MEVQVLPSNKLIHCLEKHTIMLKLAPADIFEGQGDNKNFTLEDCEQLVQFTQNLPFFVDKCLILKLYLGVFYIRCNEKQKALKFFYEVKNGSGHNKKFYEQYINAVTLIINYDTKLKLKQQLKLMLEIKKNKLENVSSESTSVFYYNLAQVITLAENKHNFNGISSRTCLRRCLKFADSKSQYNISSFYSLNLMIYSSNFCKKKESMNFIKPNKLLCKFTHLENLMILATGMLTLGHAEECIQNFNHALSECEKKKAGHSTVCYIYLCLTEAYIQIGDQKKARFCLKTCEKLASNTSKTNFKELRKKIKRMKNDVEICKHNTSVNKSNIKMCEYTYCSNREEKYKDFKQCTKCKAVCYCSKECQTKDWSKHKDFCLAREMK